MNNLKILQLFNGQDQRSGPLIQKILIKNFQYTIKFMKKAESKPIKIGKIAFKPNQTKNTINAVMPIPLIQLLSLHNQVQFGMKKPGIQLFKITQQMLFKSLSLNCLRMRACNFTDLEFNNFPNLLILNIYHNHNQTYESLQRINMPLLRKLTIDSGCCTTVQFLKKINAPNLQVLSLNYNSIMDLNDYLPYFNARQLKQLHAASYFRQMFSQSAAVQQITSLQWLFKRPFTKITTFNHKNHSILPKNLHKTSLMALKCYQRNNAWINSLFRI